MTKFVRTPESVIDLSAWSFGFGELDPAITKTVDEVVKSEFEREPPDFDIVGWAHRDPEEMRRPMEPYEILAQLTLPLGPSRECGWCYFECSLSDALREGLRRAYDDMEDGEADELIGALKSLVSVLESDLQSLKRTSPETVQQASDVEPPHEP